MYGNDYSENKIANYPIQEFPDSLSNVIQALSIDIEAPVELIAGTVLSAVSLACQTFIEVKFPDGRIKPVSIFNLILANSGERKSTIYNLLMKPFFDFEKKDKKEYGVLLNEHEAEMITWNIKKKAILKSISKKAARYDDCENETEILRNHIVNKPSEPKRMKLIYSDTTPEAMQRGLHDNISSAGLMSDEASVFFDGRAKNNLGFLNQLWDGASFDIQRRNQKSFSVDSGRFTMLLMVQPEVFLKYFKMHGVIANDIGFLARFIISPTTSNQGNRRSLYNDVNNNSLNVFHVRISDILSKLRGFVEGNEQSKIIELSSQAQFLLQKYQCESEQKIKNHSNDNAISYYLSKAPENVVRIAALFHYFESGANGEISVDTLKRAISIVQFHVEKTIYLLSATVSTPEQDAECVYNWLVKRLGTPGLTQNFIAKAFVRRLIHKHLRNSGRLNAAIKILLKEDRIWIKLHENPNGSVSEMIHLIDIN